MTDINAFHLLFITSFEKVTVDPAHIITVRCFLQSLQMFIASREVGFLCLEAVADPGGAEGAMPPPAL